MARPLNDHLAALTAMREDLDEILRAPDTRPEAIDRLCRARISVSETIQNLREGYSAAGLKKTI